MSRPRQHSPGGTGEGTCTGASGSLADFKQLSLLGEGAYSSVYKVMRLADREVYALKKVKLPSLSEKEKQNALNEIRLLASIVHENVVAYKEAFFDDKTKCLCIVQECADAGDLLGVINKCKTDRSYVREPDAWRYFVGMCHGLQALHDLRILHRDMKSANIFLSCQEGGTIAKLGDFNVSKVAKRGLCMTQTGTPYYASPEVWRDMPYDAKSDMWSLGCVLYETLSLRPPFRAEDMEGLYRKVVRGQYPKIPTHYSQDMAEVVGNLLQVHARHRPSVEQLLTMPAMLRNVPGLGTEDRNGPVSASDLLNTIKLPKNSIDLSGCLPKPRYHVQLHNMEPIPSERGSEDSPKGGSTPPRGRRRENSPKGGRRPRERQLSGSRLGTPQAASAAELGSGAGGGSPGTQRPQRPLLETPKVQQQLQGHQALLKPARPGPERPFPEAQPPPPQTPAPSGDALDAYLLQRVDNTHPEAVKPQAQPSSSAVDRGGGPLGGAGGLGGVGSAPRASSVTGSERASGYSAQGPTINPRYSSAQQLPYVPQAQPAVLASASGVGRPPRAIEPRRPMSIYARAQYTAAAAPPGAPSSSVAAPASPEVQKEPPGGPGTPLRRRRSLIPRLF